MAGGGWIVLGAAVGATGSIVTTWLNAWFARGRPDYFDNIAIKVLKNELADEHLHNIERLANRVGLNQKETKQLLLIAGAKGNADNPQLWGFK